MGNVRNVGLMENRLCSILLSQNIHCGILLDCRVDTESQILADGECSHSNEQKSNVVHNIVNLARVCTNTTTGQCRCKLYMEAQFTT